MLYGFIQALGYCAWDSEDALHAGLPIDRFGANAVHASGTELIEVGTIAPPNLYLH